MSCQILEISPDSPDFHLFRKGPEGLYPPGSQQQMNAEKIPADYLAGCFILADHDKVVARASLYDNPYLRLPGGEHALTIGNYECVDHEDYAGKLLDFITSVAKSRGNKYLIGPMNGSTWEAYRFPTDNTHPPFFLEPQQPLYYNDHFLKAGFSVIGDYYSSIAVPFNEVSPAVIERSRVFREMGVTFRPIDLKRYTDELRRIHALSSIAFARNFLFTPISEAAFLEKYAGMVRLLHPQLTILAEDKDANLVGFYFCIDDLLDKERKTLIFKTLARDPSPQWRGLGSVMGNMIYGKAIALGYEAFIHALIYDNGTSRKLSDDFGGKQFKTYALYGKEIS